MLRSRSSGGRLVRSNPRQNTRSTPKRKFVIGGGPGGRQGVCFPPCETEEEICMDGVCQPKTDTRVGM